MFLFSGLRLYVPVNFVWVRSGHFAEPIHETAHAKTKGADQWNCKLHGPCFPENMIIWLFLQRYSSVLHELCEPRHEINQLFWFPTRRFSLVCVEALRPSKQFLSHVGTFSFVETALSKDANRANGALFLRLFGHRPLYGGGNPGQIYRVLEGSSTLGVGRCAPVAMHRRLERKIRKKGKKERRQTNERNKLCHEVMKLFFMLI